MLRLSTAELQPGMSIARNIFSADGSLLLSQNGILDETLIHKLETWGIDSVFVKHPYIEVSPPEVVKEATRLEAIKMANQIFSTLRTNHKLNIGGIARIMKTILEDALNHRHVLIQMTDIRTRDDYTFGHSINVCLLSVLLGIKLRMSRRQLAELAMGAILHDLGMIFIPADILQKTTPLSREERELIQTHPQKGFELLRKIGPIPLVAAHVAFQHHENHDGSGYCRGLAGENIHLYARIVAVVDLYDAITSDRPYRRAYLPHEAYDIMLASRGTKLDARLVDLFLANVALYPVGTTVMLDSGEIGVVVKNYPQLPARPVIRIVRDSSGNLWNGPKQEIDFTEDLVRFIVKVLRPEEIFSSNIDRKIHKKE